MAVSFDVTITMDVEQFRAAIASLRPERISQATGAAVTNFLKQFFEDLDGSRANGLGGRRTHYWLAVADSTFYEADAAGSTVNIAELGYRLHLRGGTVEPGVNPSRTGRGPTQYLTIPNIPEAHGTRAGEWQGRVRLRLRRIAGAVRAVGLEERLASDDTPVKRVKGARKVLQQRRLVFKFAKRAIVQPDPSVFPDESEVLDVATNAARRQVEIIARRGS